MKICYNCGMSFDENTSLCPNCGAVNENEVTVCLDQGDSYRFDSPAPEKKNNSVLITIIIAAAVVVISIVVAIAIIVSSKGKSEEATTAPQVIEKVAPSSEAAPATTESQSQVIYYETPSTTAYQAPVYNYTSSDYLYPSDTTLLTYSYLNTKTSEEVDLITNEIYARHGYIFKMAKYQNYFGQKSWYHGTEPSMEVVASRFNSIERQNINIITNWRNNH